MNFKVKLIKNRQNHNGSIRFSLVFFLKKARFSFILTEVRETQNDFSRGQGHNTFSVLAEGQTVSMYASYIFI